MARIRVGVMTNHQPFVTSEGATIGDVISAKAPSNTTKLEFRLNGTKLTSDMYSQVLVDGDTLVWTEMTKGNARIRVGVMTNHQPFVTSEGATIGDVISAKAPSNTTKLEFRLNGTKLTSDMYSQVLVDGDTLVWTEMTKGNKSA